MITYLYTDMSKQIIGKYDSRIILSNYVHKSSTYLIQPLYDKKARTTCKYVPLRLRKKPNSWILLIHCNYVTLQWLVYAAETKKW